MLFIRTHETLVSNCKLLDVQECMESKEFEVLVLGNISIV